MHTALLGPHHDLQDLGPTMTYKLTSSPATCLSGFTYGHDHMFHWGRKAPHVPDPRWLGPTGYVQTWKRCKEEKEACKGSHAILYRALPTGIVCL